MKQFAAPVLIRDNEVWVKVTDMADFFRKMAEDSWFPEQFLDQAEFLEAAAFRTLQAEKEKNEQKTTGA